MRGASTSAARLFRAKASEVRAAIAPSGRHEGMGVCVEVGSLAVFAACGGAACIEAVEVELKDRIAAALKSPNVRELILQRHSSSVVPRSLQGLIDDKFSGGVVCRNVGFLAVEDVDQVLIPTGRTRRAVEERSECRT